MIKHVVILKGVLKKDPYGTWDDVDKGWFVDGDLVVEPLSDFKNKKVRITIEEISEDSKEE